MKMQMTKGKILKAGKRKTQIIKQRSDRLIGDPLIEVRALFLIY